MALIPRRHWRDMEVLRRGMDSLWDRFTGERPTEWLRGEWVPSLDVSETKDKVVVKAEAPGIDPKEIAISLKSGILTLKGEKKQEREEKDESYHLIERSYGSFSRSVRLPAEVQGSGQGQLQRWHPYDNPSQDRTGQGAVDQDRSQVRGVLSRG